MTDRRKVLDLGKQVRLVTPLLMVWTLGATVIAVAALQNQIPLTSLFLDPSAISNLPWYVGVLSNLGILAWTVASVSAVGGAWVAHQTGRHSAARFLGYGGAAAAVLLFDDLFRLHSSAFPKLLGVPKVVGVVMVTLPTLVWFVVFIAEIGRTRWLILVAALHVRILSSSRSDPSGQRIGGSSNRRRSQAHGGIGLDGLLRDHHPRHRAIHDSSRDVQGSRRRVHPLRGLLATLLPARSPKNLTRHRERFAGEPMPVSAEVCGV